MRMVQSRRKRTKRRLEMTAIALLALVLIATSCTSNTSSAEQLQTFMDSGVDCQAPCWRGLVPGMSTVKDFETLVDASSSRNFHDLREIALHGSGMQYIWEDEIASKVMEMETVDATITLIAYFPHRSLDLATVLEVMGLPDSYIAYISTLHDSIFDLFMFYERRGVVIQIRQAPFDGSPEADSSDCEVRLSDDMPVREIFLLEPAPASKMKEDLSRVLFRDDEVAPWQSNDTIKLTSC